MSAEFDQPGDERIAELLVDAWEKELTPEQRTELQRLMAFSGEITAEDFEYAAAALHVALVAPELEQMPGHLRASILSAAGVSAETPSSLDPGAGPIDVARASAVATASLTPGVSGSPAMAGTTEPANMDPTVASPPWGWIVAFAAAVALAAVGWIVPRPPALAPVAQVELEAEPEPEPAPEPEPEPAPSELRERLLQAEGDALVQVAWSATEDAYLKGKKVGGDVVWSPERQEGYMRFVGLPRNDPGQAQYQLWVFDKARNDKYPVDGGVFDVAQTGEDAEVVVPIRAKLPVFEASLFAVTLEEPGGVVVSSREHILTLAKL